MTLIDSQPPLSVWSTVLPVITLIAGWALAFVTELWKSRRESAAKALDRRDARLLRRNEFQRSTLLALQDALTDLSESAGASYGYRVTTPANPKPRTVSEAMTRGNTRVVVLNARVQDDSIRKSVLKLQVTFGQAQVVATPDEAQEALSNGLRQLFEINDRIGQVLREFDVLDDLVEKKKN